jgi:hypothetical protein
MLPGSIHSKLMYLMMQSEDKVTQRPIGMEKKESGIGLPCVNIPEFFLDVLNKISKFSLKKEPEIRVK